MGYSYVIILVIPVVLAILTGFAMVFILVPLWLFRPRTLTTLRKVVMAFAFAGLFVPLVFLACLVTKHTDIFSASVLWVWPGIVAPSTLPHSATSGARAVMFGIGAISNVGLYSWLGLLVGSIWKAVKR
jgi:hypothetical protein